MNTVKVKRGFEYLLIFVFVLVIYFKNFGSYYSTNIFEGYYSYWVLIISTITNFLDINIGDILYFITFPLVFYYLSKSKTRRFFLYRLFLTIIFIYSWFYLSWGFNYGKLPIVRSIDYKYNINELSETTDFYIDKINTNHIKLLLDESKKLVIQSSFEEIVNECKKSFEKLDYENFNIKKLKVNKSYFSKVLNLRFVRVLQEITGRPVHLHVAEEEARADEEGADHGLRAQLALEIRTADGNLLQGPGKS